MSRRSTKQRRAARRRRESQFRILFSRFSGWFRVARRGGKEAALRVAVVGFIEGRSEVTP